MADTANITLPFLVLDAQPVPTISAAITLPQVSVYGGNVAWDGSAALTLPALELTANTYQAGGSASIALPQLTLSATMGAVAAISLPQLTISAGAYEVSIGTAELTLPQFELDASGSPVLTGTAEVSLPGLVLAAGVATGSYGEAALSLPWIRLDSSGSSGEAGTASVTLPALTLSAISGEAVTGTADIDLPMVSVFANGYTSPADVWRTWVMNLSNKAVTEYTGFEFTSYIVFRGNVYASDSSGIYKLDSSRNDGLDEISGSFTTGNYNFSDSHTKRVPRAYVEGKFSGDMKFTTEVPVGGQRGYSMYYDGVDSIRTRRIPIGRGPRSVYWTFGMSNVAGSYFEISRILLHPEVTKRRVF